MNKRLIIYAPNVHQGGGRTLLLELLAALANNSNFTGHAFMDARMDVPSDLQKGVIVTRVKPDIIHRLKAEWILWFQTGSEDTVICFGNLPPLFNIRAKVIVFIQNRYLIERVNLNGFPVIVKLRLILERMWLKWRSGSVHEFVVQTPTMQRIMKNYMNILPSVLPFISETSSGNNRTAEGLNRDLSDKYDFLYVASSEPHKNHKRLIEAWCLLAEDGVWPTLCLTVNEKTAPELCAWIIGMKNRYGLRINNVGSVARKDVLLLYNNACAFIFPSTFESFGLPLIEAKQAGLPVLASELDFVRDILDPEESFDPYSAVSIVRAVKRFMKIPDRPLPLLNASEFIERITERVH